MTFGGENYLRISCPIEEKGLKAKEQAVDFTVPGEEILTDARTCLSRPYLMSPTTGMSRMPVSWSRSG